MFGIGGTEFIILIIIVAILIGPDQIPSVLKGVNKFMKEISGAREDFKRTVEEDETLRDVKSTVLDVQKSVHDQVEKLKQSIEDDQKKEDGSTPKRNDHS